MLLIPTFVIAMAVLIKGYADIGDGFSAGVIASLGVILQGIAFGPDTFDELPLARLAPAGTLVGLLIALGTAFGPVLFGHSILEHRPGPGEQVIHFGSLELITAVAFDVGVFLVVFGFCIGSMGAIARALQRQGRGHGSRAEGSEQRL